MISMGRDSRESIGECPESESRESERGEEGALEAAMSSILKDDGWKRRIKDS
jgi:hypothetical protein